jgi:predicted ATPase
MQQGLAAYQTTGAELQTSRRLALLAEAYGKAGRIEEGLNTLTEALSLVDKTGERYYEAEIYRLRGTLMHQSKTSQQQAEGKSKTGQDESEATNTQHLTSSPQAEAEAEACFHKAIDIARKQEAKSLELRAVMSLARLWQRQGKRDEARQMLAEIYGWFTEGFDTADLQEAKTLLEELK